MKLTGKLLEKYLENPNGMDEEVREALKLPDNRYYSIVTWSINEASIGNVYVSRVERVVKNKKVSKSDQKSNP